MHTTHADLRDPLGLQSLHVSLDELENQWDVYARNVSTFDHALSQQIETSTAGFITALHTNGRRTLMAMAVNIGLVSALLFIALQCWPPAH